MDGIVFDFDRTITRTDTIKFLLLSLFISDPARGFVKITDIIGKLRSIPETKHRIISYFIAGKSISKVRRSLKVYRILTSIFYRREMIRKILSSDIKIIIASASPGFALGSLRELCKADIIATEYEIVDGVFTGALKGSVCYGEEKLKRVNNWLNENKNHRIIEAYTDHYSDFPMLSIAEKKILVKPDKKTILLAGKEVHIL